MGWFDKLKAGLGKTSSRITGGIGNLFTGKRRLDDETLEELEEVLITADLVLPPLQKSRAVWPKPVLTRKSPMKKFAKPLLPISPPFWIPSPSRSTSAPI